MKTRLPDIVSIIVFTFFICSWAVAQPAIKAAADKTAIRIGEPINIKLTATWPGKSTVIEGFVIPDSLRHFDIWERKNPLIIKDGIEQEIVITSYDSGKFTVPGFLLNVTDSSGAGAQTDSFQVTVIPVNVDSLADYHDIKDIIPVAPLKQWPYLAGLSAVTLISLAIIYFLVNNMQAYRRENTPVVPVGHPYELAMKALEKLEKNTAFSGPMAGGAAKTFFTELTQIYRNYIRDAYRFSSLQQTGDELILQAKSLLEQDLYFPFANMIRLGDAAKFAKYEPPPEEWAASLKTMKKTIGILDEHATT